MVLKNTDADAKNDPKTLSGKRGAPAQFSMDQVLWAAWLYYELGLKQDQIAEQLGISRASVFNLLQKARDEGVVTIAIDPTRIARAELALKITEASGLTECFVVPTLSDQKSIHEQIGHMGARVLENRLHDNDTIGVAWGRTVLALSHLLTPVRRPNITIAQITGSSAATFDFSPVLCSSNIAERLSARCVNLHAPGVVSSPYVKDILMAEPAIKQHFALLRQCTKMVFGVTQLTGVTLLVKGGFMTQAEIQTYLDLGAVGFASGYFFNDKGEVVKTEFDERHITMPLDDMLTIPERICVGGGVEKTDAICAILRAKVATVLIVDEATALQVLKQLSHPHQNGEGSPPSA